MNLGPRTLAMKSGHHHVGRHTPIVFVVDGRRLRTRASNRLELLIRCEGLQPLETFASAQEFPRDRPRAVLRAV